MGKDIVNPKSMAFLDFFFRYRRQTGRIKRQERMRSAHSPTVAVEVKGSLMKVLANQTRKAHKGPSLRPMSKAGTSSKWRVKNSGKNGNLMVKMGTT